MTSHDSMTSYVVVAIATDSYDVLGQVPGALSPDLPQSTSGTFSTAAGKPCWMPQATAWARLTASILR
jgi:hypothetical protein